MELAIRTKNNGDPMLTFGENVLPENLPHEIRLFVPCLHVEPYVLIGERRNGMPVLAPGQGQGGRRRGRKLETVILDAAEALRRFAKLRLHFGSGAELRHAADEAVAKTSEVLGRIAPEVIAYVEPSYLLDQLAEIKRQLTILDREADRAKAEGSTDDLQAHAAETGRNNLFLAQYGVNRLAPDLRAPLTKAGHLAETPRLYLDGGVSAQKIIDDIKQASAAFHQTTAHILPS